MKRQLYFTVFVMVLVTAACQPPAETTTEAPEPAGFSDADRAAIEAVSQAFAEGAAAKDWAAVAATYAEDAVLMPPHGPVVQGRDNIQAFFEAFPAHEDFSLETVEIGGHGDLAFVRGVFSMTITPDGADPVAATGKFIEIRRKQADGSWPIVRDIFNSDVPAPE